MLRLVDQWHCLLKLSAKNAYFTNKEMFNAYYKTLIRFKYRLLYNLLKIFQGGILTSFFLITKLKKNHPTLSLPYDTHTD